MKQRYTFIRDPSHGELNRTLYEVKDGHLTVPSLRGPREHQVTASLSELPTELVKVLEQCRELHVRYVSPAPYNTVTPFDSRLSPGLHVFWTPEDYGKAEDLCAALKTLFGPAIVCEDASSFTSPPILSPRFSSSPSQQLYSPPSSITLSTLQELLGDTFCQTNIQPCLGALSLIPVANSLDFNYDAISHSAVASLYTAAPIGARGWRDKIFADPAGRVEVGVLNSEPRTDTMDTHEQRLGGILTVVEPDASEQKRPGAALFTVPARHHTVPGAQFSASIDQPAGLHPTLRISMQGLGGATATGALEPGCKLHAYLTLPRGVFLDRHTLTDELTLSSHNLTKLHALSGATDLEAPAYSVAQWGSAALFELSAPPADATEDAAHTATVPLHARYLRPADGGVAHVEIPAPALFFACPAEAGAKFPISPFDRAALGYDGLFGVRTLFRHVTPEAPAIDVAEGAEGAGLVSVLEVPVLDTAGALTAYIAPITIAVVAAGFAWLVWTLVRPVAGSPETDKTKSTTKGKTSTSGSGAKGKSPAKAKGN